MDTSTSQTETPARLRVTRRFKASPQRVWRAWTEPELMMRWFVDTDADIRVCEVDLRTGGRYRLEGMAGGNPWRLRGEYLEVTPPTKLVYTWKWDDDPSLGGPGDTIVTVEFREVGKETELTVTQDGFESELARKEHMKGWEGCLDRLGSIVV